MKWLYMVASFCTNYLFSDSSVQGIVIDTKTDPCPPETYILGKIKFTLQISHNRNSV